MRVHLIFRRLLRVLASSCFFASMIFALSQAQQVPQKPPDKKPEKAAQPEKSENPYQIELLETRYRFEANGDSRKEVHTRVHINNELGVRPFARLNFDYNRSFESIEIPLVHITHPSGGTADILPNAITDNPNPAVVNAPAYQDVRVKSVRILGLEPGDLLEYRIITATAHHPLAPDFWLDHSFDRSGIVSQEIFELDLPASRFEKNIQADDPTDPLHLAPPPVLRKPPVSNIYFSPDFQPSSVDSVGEGDSVRTVVRWQIAGSPTPQAEPTEPDIALSTFSSQDDFSRRLAQHIDPRETKPAEIVERKLEKLILPFDSYEDKQRKLYDFVSKNIHTIDLPLGSTGFITRPPEDILSTGYGSPEDKIALLLAVHRAAHLLETHVLLVSSGESLSPNKIRPTLFQHIVASGFSKRGPIIMDPSIEVAPIGLVPSNLRGKAAFLVMNYVSSYDVMVIPWGKIPIDLPFPAKEAVRVDATLAVDGKLTAKVHYSMRGDNELLLRVAFHQSPKDKWKELAQLLSISDGFRGQVTTVTASDPYATKQPFTVDYELSQPKFVDWAKKPVHIPALLPQLGLPDPPAKQASGSAASPVELGTPLEVETHMILHLPPGTVVAPPTGTSVQRDYATFASQYSVKGLTVSATRHINFLLRQVPADRTGDYNAFLHAVQSDEAQVFTLDRESPPAPATKPTNSPAIPPPTRKP